MFFGGILQNPGLSGGYDVDAAAFITAASITDTTQKSAVNGLVVDLKAANIWSKMFAIYPLVGGTASCHSYNLKDPRDLDAAFRLTFSGAWAHNSSGINPGTGASYADSHLVPSSVLDQNSNHASYWNQNNGGSGADRWNLGAYGATGFGMTLYNSNQAYFFPNTTGFNPGSSASLVTTGLFTISRTASNLFAAFIADGTKYSNTNAPGANLSIPLYVNSFNLNGTNAPVGQVCAFASFGSGLSDADAAALRTAVITYQSALGR